MWKRVVLLVFAAGCALPARNNARDPGIAPSPSLLFRDLGLPSVVDGVVTCPVPSASAPVVAVAGRGTCLQLDASLSDDPQGGALRYRFAVAGNAEADFEWLGVMSSSSQFVLAPGILREFAVGANPPVFRVRVRDGSGNFSDLDVPLVVADTPPVAASIPSRRLPVGGFPWGGPLQLDFHGTAIDADQDTELSYCWNFGALAAASACAITPEPDGAICSLDRRDPCFTRLIPSDVVRRYTARLEVRDDGGAVSEPVTSVVGVASPMIWTRPGGNIPGPHFQRLDGERETFAYDNYATVALFDTLSPPVLVVADRPVNDFEVQLAEFPTAKPLGAAIPLAPANAAGIGADPAQLRLWSLSVPYTAPGGTATSRLRTFLVDPDAGTLNAELDFDIAEGGNTVNFNRSIVVDATGNAWIGRNSAASEVLRVVTPNGVVTDLSSSGKRWAGLAARPSGEIWTTLVPDASTPGAPFDTAKLVRFSSPSLRVEYETGLGSVSSIAFAGDDEMWLGSVSEGLFLLDLPALESGGFEAAIRLHISMVQFGELVADPITGSVFGLDAESSFRVSDEGLLARFDSNVLPTAIDSEGLLWFGRVSGFGLGRGETNAVHGDVAGIDYLVALSPSVDLLTGGIVTGALGASGLARFSADGELTEVVDSILYEGDTTPVIFPPLFPLRVAPGTNVMWGIVRAGGTVLGLDRFDLEDGSARRVKDDAFAADLMLLEPSAPEPQNPSYEPFVWIVRESLGDVAIVAEDGTVTPVFTIPGDERDGGLLQIQGARALGTNELCLTTLEDPGSSPQLHVRRIGAGGTVELLETVNLPASYKLGGVAAFSSTPNASCWVAYTDDGAATYSGHTNTVIGWRAPGTPANPAYTLLQDRITSIQAVSNDRFWITVDRREDSDSNGTDDLFLNDHHRLTFSGASWVDEAQLDVEHLLLLNGVENSLRPF